ncbi:uncharacterized protein LAESUDRAFT_814974 [Laetiporus sulphureus 93-53]|uniref:Uncharacterized protein n=1 Tax=Laetiporus sulphureus 93-53 TaxID=1314785 RepID=A0A165CKR9_9APHY|nr:uncharacterized protein LAESUDRAFT_814974 [Laetiporus sulphureus 93-53]KZT02986.1 hypothetical protein LAESUDRAFT_814974 [Laetiporus sulphureus 93-53]
MPRSSLFPLNDTVLVFLHPDDTLLPSPIVVQVSVKIEGPERVESIAAYFNAQRDIADLVKRVITAHLREPLPRPVVFEGDAYTLAARCVRWTYGKKVKLAWGEEDVLAGDDKWVFVFRPK